VGGRAVKKKSKVRGGQDSFPVWGGVGVRGWPSPGGRYTRILDPGLGHTQPGGGKRSCWSGPKKEGGPLLKYA
jgi:hypothetical protein